MISLRDLRTQHQLTMDEMAGIIGTTRQTYSRIEKGDSDLSLGQAVRLTDHFDINIDNFISDDVWYDTVGEKDFDRDKYKQIIKNFIKFGWAVHDHKITKTKLAKLCYLLDFGRYYSHLNSVTWLQYRRIQQWPVADIFFTTIEEMEAEEAIMIEHKWAAYMISNISDVRDELLQEEEKEFLMEIAQKRQDADTWQIVEFTHKQLPWILCDDKEIIPYDLITQEDPHNVY